MRAFKPCDYPVFSRGGGNSLKDILIYVGTQMTALQFYTGGWLKDYGVGVPNGALWTITVDIQFYLAATFLVKWLKGRRIKTWSTVIALGMIFDLVLEKEKGLYPEIGYKLLQCNLVPFLWIFLIGMCVYYNRNRIIPLIVKLKWVFMAVYLLWQYLVPNSIVKLFDGVRYNLITTLLMLLMLTGIGFSYKKRLKQDYSYSFYLYHMVVINFIINNVCGELTSVRQFVITFFASITGIGILAVLSHKYIAGSLTKKIKNKFL